MTDLDQERIPLKTGGIPSRVECLDCVTSTNTVLLERMEAGAVHGHVLVADGQTAGKGRLGRRWESPAGCNLYFSILVDKGINRAFPSELVIVAATALARGLQSVSGLSVKLRWPNDLFIRGRKVGGILMEYITHLGRGPGVIIGIGINVNSAAAEFSPGLAATATSLKLEAGRRFDRGAVLAVLLAAMEADLAEYGKTGIQPFLQRWMNATDLNGSRIRVAQGDQSWDGTFVGLDPHGALQVKTADGAVRTVVAGDVTQVTPEPC